MPVGILTNVLAVLLGGLLGTALKKWLAQSLVTGLTDVFGFCSMAIGITLIIRLDGLSVVVLAMVLGTLLGTVAGLEKRTNAAVAKICARIPGQTLAGDAFCAQFCAALVLFCASGTGLFGALNEGFTGDATILMTKSILDFFTAAIFAAGLGVAVSLIAVPQLVVYLALFFVAKPIMPIISPAMLADFSAVGGIITLMAGFRITGIKQNVAVLNSVPAILLAFPINWLWNTLVPA